jgi:hypothetical protein
MKRATAPDDRPFSSHWKEDLMIKTFLALGAAVAALSTTPAVARHYSNTIKCSGWRNGECVAWNRLTRDQARDIGVGFVFPKNYTYTEYSTLPQAVVTQYHLDPNERYVSTDGYVYVVDPSSYAVTKVITVPGS